MLPYQQPAKHIRACFDGSLKGKSGAYGRVSFAAEELHIDDLSAWKMVASKSGVLSAGASITEAELEAVLSLISFLHSYYQSFQASGTEIDKTPHMDHKAIGVLS